MRLQKPRLFALFAALPLFGCGARGKSARNQQPSLAPAGLATTCRKAPRVVLYAGAGAWPEGVAALHETVNELGWSIVETRGADFVARDAELLLVGGGWAPSQRDAFGPRGLSEVQRFVRAGGGYVGICAGAYLASRTVRWEGQDYDYPLALFDGVAEGPIAGLPSWPGFGTIELARAPEDAEAGSAGSLRAHYYGGASFSPLAPNVKVLLRYPNGAAAALSLSYGQGRVLLTGPHLEGPASAEPGLRALDRRFFRHALRWAARDCSASAP